MLDILTAIVLVIIVGGAGGFINSIIKWLSIEESFSSKKNVKAILIGVLTGLSLGIAAVSAINETITVQSFVVIIGMLFLSAAGVDSITSSASGAVASRAKTSKVKEEAKA
jgi:predicted tellurium resistance membrane protein TerC